MSESWAVGGRQGGAHRQFAVRRLCAAVGSWLESTRSIPHAATKWQRRVMQSIDLGYPSQREIANRRGGIVPFPVQPALVSRCQDAASILKRLFG